ncbi:MAG: type 4a pilus biogenesis protein PilO [Candidatus Binatia bacterium]
MASIRSIHTAYLVVVGAVIFAIAAAFLLIQPLIGSITEIRTSIAETRATTAEREQFLQSVNRKIAELHLLRQHEQKLAVVLPETKREEDIVRIFHHSAAETGVVLNNIQNGSAGAQSNLNALRARGEAAGVPNSVGVMEYLTQGQGTYQQIRAFVDALEKSPRLATIKSIELARSQEDSNQLSVTLSAEFYVQIEESFTNP